MSGKRSRALNKVPFHLLDAREEERIAHLYQIDKLMPGTLRMTDKAVGVTDLYRKPGKMNVK